MAALTALVWGVALATVPKLETTHNLQRLVAGGTWQDVINPGARVAVHELWSPQIGTYAPSPPPAFGEEGYGRLHTITDGATGNAGWLGVVLCSDAVMPAALVALELFEPMGFEFDPTVQSSCNVMGAGWADDWEFAFKENLQTGELIPNSKHWIASIGSASSKTYAYVFGSLSPRPVGATVVFMVDKKPTPLQTHREAGWDILVNAVDFSGFELGYASQFAPATAYPGGAGPATVKFAVDIVVHELMHVLGAGHIVGGGPQLHSSMYQGEDWNPRYPYHFALEVDADLYHPDGVVPGRRVVPMADQVFLAGVYGFSLPEQLVWVPWQLISGPSPQGTVGEWKPWAADMADDPAFDQLSGTSPSFYVAETAECDLDCVDIQHPSMALWNELPSVAATYVPPPMTTHVRLVPEGGSDPCFTWYADLDAIPAPAGELMPIRRDGSVTQYCVPPTGPAEPTFGSLDVFAPACPELPDLQSAGGRLHPHVTHMMRDPIWGGAALWKEFSLPWVVDYGPCEN